MTSLQLSDTLPIHLYERALAGHPVGVQLEDGTHAPLTADVWSRPRPGDGSVVSRCHGATLDVGCGSGRFTEAVAAAGLAALGIDISPHAVRLARRRGVQARQRDVFAQAPSLGRWKHVLLMDGNIGIGGDPGHLLQRCRELLARDGTVLVETGPPGTGSRGLLVRLVHAGASSRPFRWHVSDANGIRSVAAAMGLRATDEWTAGGRWFLELSPPATGRLS
ncbi:MAG TPA: class I SAM-dependent methyltransferase [Frankiaceae bacterium]|jgi:SAM-dependent methyltransferase|nr:class I SAM-dependent methyltransferase [Frankiaceae bacterium]